MLEFGAVIDEAEFQFVESSGAALGFGGGHQLGAQAFPLTSGFDRDQAKVGSLAARFDEDAGRERAVVFTEEKFSASPHLGDRVGVDAFAFDVGTFGDEGAIDQADDGVEVARFAVAEGEGDIEIL